MSTKCMGNRELFLSLKPLFDYNTDDACDNVMSILSQIENKKNNIKSDHAHNHFFKKG